MSKRNMFAISCLIGIVMTFGLFSMLGGAGSAQDAPKATATTDKDIENLKNVYRELRGKYEHLREDITGISQFATDLSHFDPPVGTIMAYGGDWSGGVERHEWEVRTGWMLCDGRKLNGGEYPELASALATNWGGDAGNFHIPDPRGRFLRGVSSSSIVDNDVAPEAELRKESFPGGNTGNKVGTKEPFATAKPLMAFKAEGGAHQHPCPTSSSGVNAPGDWEVPNKEAEGMDYGTLHGEMLTAPDRGQHTHLITGGDKETRPVNVAVHWIIKYKSKNASEQK